MKKIGLLACLFGALLTSACKKKTADPDALLAPSSAASDAACANPLELAGVTAKADLAWQQDPAVEKLVSTVNYGNHSVLALSTQFNGDNLVYHVVSVNHPDANTDLHTAPDGTQCAYVVKGQSNTGYVEISTLCAGEVYQILLQTCNRNGDCSAEKAMPAPYLQDRNRDAGVQSALAGVTQSRAEVEATATQAYKTIITYLHAHKGDSNPTPERKQFLSMAQNVEDMGLDLYKVVMYTHYQDTLATVQANFHLADSTSAAAAPTGTDGCTPISQIVGGPDRQPSAPTTSNAVGDTSGAGSTPAATVTVNHTVSVVVTETETETVTGSTSLTSGQKAEIAVGSVFLFAGALLTVGLILKQNDLRKAGAAQQKAMRDGGLPQTVEELRSEFKTKVSEISEFKPVSQLKETFAYGDKVKRFYSADSEIPKNQIDMFDADGKKIDPATGNKATAKSYRESLYVENGKLMQGGKETGFKVGTEQKVFYGESTKPLISSEKKWLWNEGAGAVEIGGKPVEPRRIEIGKINGLDAAIAAEKASLKNVEIIKGEKVKIWGVKEKVSAEKATGYVGIAIGVLLVVGAILTAVGGSGSGLADTGSTAEADLLTALSPLALQQSSNLVQYHVSFVPVSTAAQASTAGKK